MAPIGAFAHVERGHATLRELVGRADAVIRARVIDARGAVALPAVLPPEVADELPPMRRPAVVVEVEETLKGEVPEGRLRVLHHGHGVAAYRDAEEVLIFLRPTKKIRELADTRLVKAAPWTSLQQHDDRVVLDREHGAGRLAAARRYVALAGLSPAERSQAVAALTVELLLADDAWLASVALLDLTRSGRTERLSQEDLTGLLARVDDPSVSIDFRVGVLSELSRRQQPAVASRWVALLKGTRGDERSTVCLAAGQHPSRRVTAELVRILHGQEAVSARAAAVALGGGGHTNAVPALAGALADGEEGLRNAAIRGLGRIGGDSARRVLLKAANGHADPATRRRASAELTARFETRGVER